MNSEAAYWLALVNASGLKLSVLKPVAQKWYLMEERSIAQLFNLSAAELAFRFNLSETDAKSILQAADSYQRQLTLLEQWQAQDIQLIPLSHPHYPTRLVYTLPPIQQPLLLWAKGKTELLAEPTITFLGNSNPQPQAVQYIKNLIEILVEENIGVVSGYGKGLDRSAFESILTAEHGHAVAILPMGLTAFSQLTNKLDAPVAGERAVLLSPYPPDTPYKETLADARNTLVDSLAMALLVPQIDQAAHPRAKAALDRGMPVLVGNTDSPASRDLIAAGAFLMTDPEEVVEMVQQAIIDNAMQAQIAQQPAQEKAPSLSPPKSGDDDDDDYALSADPLDPIAADEALDILSAAGKVPNSLRAKLMALEKQAVSSKQ